MLCVLRMAYESVLALVIAANAPIKTHSEYILHCVGCRAWGKTPCVHYVLEKMLDIPPTICKLGWILVLTEF